MNRETIIKDILRSRIHDLEGDKEKYIIMLRASNIRYDKLRDENEKLKAENEFLRNYHGLY